MRVDADSTIEPGGLEKAVCRFHDSSVAATDLAPESLPDLWRTHGEDPLSRQAQDDVVESLYLQKALRFSREAGLVRPLSLLLVYDAILQHGFSPVDPDGLPKLLRCARDEAGGTPASGIDETLWSLAFLSIRESVLRHSSNTATRQAWASSAPRVETLQKLVEHGHWQLDQVVTINPWGSSFTLDGSVAGTSKP